MILKIIVTIYFVDVLKKASQDSEENISGSLIKMVQSK